MQLTTSWKEEGRKEGLQEGRQEGLQKGRRDGSQQIVLRLLRKRWRALPAGLEKKVRRLPVGKLESLAEAILEFSSPSDVEVWLKRT